MGQDLDSDGEGDGRGGKGREGDKGDKKGIINRVNRKLLRQCLRPQLICAGACVSFQTDLC
jgi:hypothetical protein